MSEKVFLEVEDVKPVYLFDKSPDCLLYANDRIIGIDVTINGQTKQFECGILSRDNYAYKILDEKEHADGFFKKGTEAAFDLMKELYAIYDTHPNELYEVFNYYYPSEIIESYDYEELRELLDKWKNRIVVGDEIRSSIGSIGVITYVDTVYVYVLWKDGTTGEYVCEWLDDVTKTGKHFDEIANYIQH